MAHMELQIFKKGATYVCDCAKCGASLYCHEWAHGDNNERRDAMQAGTLRCDDCVTGLADPQTFKQLRDHYAGWYSAPGYLDATDLHYDTNRRRLERTLRELYS